MTIDQIIALLASVGACLAALATFLTVRQIAKQREASYRPELALSRTVFDGSADPITKGALPTLWVRKAQDGEAEPTSRTFAIPLRNVGLGTAKGVAVSWSFPISEVVEEVNQLAQRSLTPAYFTYENGALSVKSDSLGNSTSFWRNQDRDSIDYVLPAAVQKEPVLVHLPHTYIQLCSALLFLGAKDKDRKSFPEIPVLRASFDYYDIGARKHQAVFEIKFQLVALGGNGEFIQGYLDAKKSA